jgi:hypothetical protein
VAGSIDAALSIGDAVNPRANSFIDPNRSAGTFSIARITADSILAGVVFRRVRIGGGGSAMCRIAIALAVGPVNGGSPTNISYNTHANAY